MKALGAARNFERAGALALALGVAIAMSAEPPIAHANRGEIAPAGVGTLPPIGTEMSAPDQMSASGGWVGVLSAILVALGCRPSACAGSRSSSGRPLMELFRSVFRRRGNGRADTGGVG